MTAASLHRRALLAGAGALALSSLPGRVLAAPQVRSDPSGLDALARDFNGRIIRPDEPGFTYAAMPNNARWADVRPQAIAMCADGADVECALVWARDNRVPFAIRSGGHNYAGFSTTRGLLIDLKAMNRVTLDLAAGTAAIQGGANNENMASALRIGNFAVPSGRCPTVGAGGLTLGGGWGFSATRAGLTCDSLLSTEAVLADGKTHSIDAKSEPDLFWAARGGGGGNYGVHTAFTFRLHDVGPVTTFRLEWPPGKQTELMVALQRMQQDHPRSISTRSKIRPQAAGRFPSRNSLIVETLGLYWGRETELREVLAPVLAIAAPKSADIYEMGYWRARDYLATDDPNGLYEIKSRYVAGALSAEAIETMQSWMTRWPGGSLRQDNMGLLFAIGGAVRDVRPDATAYVHRDSDFLFEMEANWGPIDRPETVAAQRDWLADYAADMQRFLLPRSYVNFPDRGQADWKTAYYGDNLSRLSAIKRRYDPGNLFSFPQSIPLEG
ncbi:FAD-binding oxidoreductase [Acidisoma sp. 7E03]